MIKALKQFFKNLGMSETEKYLSQSSDLVDLENRMKELKHKGRFWI